MSDMQISIENISTLGRKLTITLPSENIENDVTQEIKKLVPKANIKGFRPGKAPLKIIKSTYESSVRFDVIDKHMRKNLSKALEQEKLHPATLPEVDLLQMAPGEPLKFTASFEILPEIKLKTLENTTINKTISEITEKDIDKTIEAIRKQHTHYKKVERPAKINDKLTISFTGLIDNQAVPSASAKSVDIVLGSHQFIPGFEEGLVGATLGQEIKLNLTFPQDYHHKDFAGKPVEFTIEVNDITEPELPKLDEKFFEAFGLAEKTLEAFRNEIKSNMERETAQVCKRELKQAVFDKLLEVNPIEAPQGLINNECERLQQEMLNSFKARSNGKLKSPMTLPKELFTKRATYHVKLSLLLAEAQKQFQLKVDNQRIRAAMEEEAALYVEPDIALKSFEFNPEKMKYFESLIMEELLVEKLLEAAQLLEKRESYQHLMKQESNKEEEHVHGPDCDHDHHDEVK